MANQDHSFADFSRALNGVLKAIAAGEMTRPIFAFGPSDYLLRKTANALRDAWNAHDAAPCESIEARDLTEASLATIWQQPALFGQKTLYLIKRCEDASQLAVHMKRLPAETVPESLVCFLMGSAAPVAKIRDEMKRIHASFVPAFEPTLYDLPKFLQGLAKKMGFDLQIDAAQLLTETTGHNLDQLENELAKLSLIFASGESKKAVTAKDAAPLLGILREDHAFELVNLICEKRYAHAELFLHELMRRGESALAVLAIISRHVRNSIRIFEAMRRGDNPQRIAASVRLPLPVVKRYTQYVTTIGELRLKEALRFCGDADKELKSSGIPDELVLSRILTQLMD